MNQTQYNYHINKFNEQIEKLQDVLYTLNQLHVSIETIIAVQDEMQKIIDAKYQFVKANQPKQYQPTRGKTMSKILETIGCHILFACVFMAFPIAYAILVHLAGV